MKIHSKTVAESNVFVRGGYVGCIAATVCLTIAIYLAVSSPLMLAQKEEVINAVLVSIATSLCTVAIIFETCLARTKPSPLMCLITGIAAMPVVTGILSINSIVPWVAIMIVAIRQIIILLKLRTMSVCVIVLFGAFIGYWVFLLSYVDGYKTPWINEEIITGTVHVDMMFHAAIINMLSDFKIGSAGIDGILPFPYHFGSHRIAVVFCHLLKIDALSFYAIIFPLLFGPIFLTAFFFFVTTYALFLIKNECIRVDFKATDFSILFWIAFFVIFVGLSPVTYRRNLGVWDNVFHSESFGLAVLASYLGAIWLIDKFGRQNLLWIRWYVYPLASLYLIVLCSLKISVGAVIGGLFAYFVLRCRLNWVQRFMGFSVISCAVFYGYAATQGVAHNSDSGSGILTMFKPFAFIRDILPLQSWLPSFLAFFGPTIVFLILRFLKFKNWKSIGLKKISKEIPRDVEMVIVVTIISIIPGLILSIPQGSTNFFAEISYWWIQPMLAVVLASTFSDKVKRNIK